MDNFLNRLAPRPSDYGGLPGKITRDDDAGNVYDETGRKIFNKFDQTEQPDSWLDTAISTATAPAKLATALVGSLNPYGQDGWQVPPIISEPAAAFARSGESTGFGDDGRFYLPNVQNPQVAQDTLTQLMTVYGGNALNPLARVPKGGLASGAVKQAADSLPMDQASRLARARDMGFDTENVLYHGTGKDFEAFDPGKRGNGATRNIYLTDNPDIADIYANSKNYGLRGAGDPMIYPVVAKSEKPLIVSDKGPDGSFGWVSNNLAAALGLDGPPGPGKYHTLYEEALRQGYDQVQIREMTDLGGPQTQYIPLKPEYIRSVNAAFDPARAGENGLLLSDNKPSLLGSALASGQGEEDILALLGYR